MRRSLLALAFAAALSSPAVAQITPYPGGPTVQSSLALVAPTPPTAANNNQIATTAWVNNLVNAGLPLASGKIWIGSVGNVATAQTPSGDLTVSTGGVFTLATVNANVGAFGSATQCATITTNAKGLITAASATTCTPAVGSITGLGTGVSAALANNVGGAGSVVVFNGAGGTPASMVATNVTALNATQLTTGTVPNARLNATITPQGRLTLTTATPVLTATVSGATTVFYTPYIGNLVPIYDGTNMVPTVFAEVSQATTDATKSPAAVAASSCYDNFLWVDSGTNRISRGPVWTNTTTRSAGTALTMVNGIYLNNASITNGPAASRGTYVGTMCSNGASTIDYIFGAIGAGGTAANFGVWNAYNRSFVSTFVADSTDTWTYNVASTWRAANNSATIRATFVRGLAIDSVTAHYNAAGQSGAATNAVAGIGLDATNAASGSTGFINAFTSGFLPTVAAYNGLPGIGQHFISAIEFQNTTTASTWLGDAGTPTFVQTGLDVQLFQ